MDLVRPNGMVERLARVTRPAIEFDGYGRAQPGPATAQTLRLAAQQDRRRQPDPTRGRLFDVTA